MTRVYILLLLLCGLLFAWSRVIVNASALQTNVVKCVLIRYVDVLLRRDEFYFDLIAYPLNRSQIYRSGCVGTLGSPR